MEDKLKAVIKQYKADIQVNLDASGLRAKGIYKVMDILSAAFVFGGLFLSMIYCIPFYICLKYGEQYGVFLIIILVGILFMIVGCMIMHFMLQTEHEVDRMKKLDKLRGHTWKDAIDKHIPKEKRKDFFKCLLDVYKDGSKIRRLIVAFLDVVITGIMIICIDIPDINDVKTEGVFELIVVFFIILIGNLVINKMISFIEEKILRESYHVQRLIEDYVLCVLAETKME